MVRADRLQTQRLGCALTGDTASRVDRFLRPAALVLATLTLTVGLTACGSDSEDPAERPETDPATRVTGQQGDEITPEKKAPDSAGDRKNAPDDVISERPGGPASPDSP